MLGRHFSEPAFFQGMPCDKNDSGFTTHVAQHFPDGTSYDVLRHALIEENFEFWTFIQSHAENYSYACRASYAVKWESYGDVNIKRIRNIQGSCGTTCP